MAIFFLISNQIKINKLENRKNQLKIKNLTQLIFFANVVHAYSKIMRSQKKITQNYHQKNNKMKIMDLKLLWLKIWVKIYDIYIFNVNIL